MMPTNRLRAGGFSGSTALLSCCLAAGCGPGQGSDAGVVPILTPEPAGAPGEVADGRLTCLGDNDPGAPAGAALTLPGWVRALADPDNATGAQPSAEVEAYDEDGLFLASGFSDPANGRVAIAVPVRETGWRGFARVIVAGYVDQRFSSSLPVVDVQAAGWGWLMTPVELGDLATTAGVALDPAMGVLAGAVHDCDVFGVANAVIRWGGSTEGVVYLDAFAPDPALTYTGPSGRFAVGNVPPGPLVVEAFGRTKAGGPLELLSLAEVEIEAGVVTAIDLQPRVGVTR